MPWPQRPARPRLIFAGTGAVHALSACGRAWTAFYWALHMISTETLNHIESIKKRAGHLWRFL
jgi:hypothetical protein